MADADRVDRALRRDGRQEWRGLDGLDGDRPHRAPEARDRRIRRIPAAARDQHPPRLRRQFNDAGDVLGRQQSRRLDHQARAAGVMPERFGANRKAADLGPRLRRNRNDQAMKTQSPVKVPAATSKEKPSPAVATASPYSLEADGTTNQPWSA